MTLLTIFLLLFPGRPAEAQLRAQAALPSLRSSPLPVLAPLSLGAPVAGTGLTGMSFSGLSASGLLLPSISPAAVRPAAMLAPAVQPSARPLAAASLTASFSPVLKAQAEHPASAAVRSGLDRAYDGGRVSAEPADPVPAAIPSASLRPELSRPSLSAASDRKTLPEPAGEEPAVPGWKKALRILGDVASVLGSVYGGWKVADIAYSLFMHHQPLIAALPLLAVVGGAAFYLRRRAARGQGGAAFPTLLGTFAANTVGQLLWTLTGSVAGLGAGLVLGALAGLYAAGILPRLKP